VLISIENVYVAYFDLLGVGSAIIKDGLASQAKRLHNFYSLTLFEGSEWGRLFHVGGFSDTLYIEAIVETSNAGFFLMAAEHTFEILKGLEVVEDWDGGPSGLRGFVARGERISGVDLNLGVYQPEGSPVIVPTSTAVMKAYMADGKGENGGFEKNCLYVEDLVLQDAGKSTGLGPTVELKKTINGQEYTFARFVCFAAG